MNIEANLDNHLAMQNMAKALDISEDNLSIDDSGDIQLLGKPNKPLKAIQRLPDKYIYYIEAKSMRIAKSIRRKLINFGWAPVMQQNLRAYLSLRRLPEGEEPAYLRTLLGIRQRRPYQLKNQISSVLN